MDCKSDWAAEMLRDFGHIMPALAYQAVSMYRNAILIAVKTTKQKNNDIIHQ